MKTTIKILAGFAVGIVIAIAASTYAARVLPLDGTVYVPYAGETVIAPATTIAPSTQTAGGFTTTTIGTPTYSPQSCAKYPNLCDDTEMRLRIIEARLSILESKVK